MSAELEVEAQLTIRARFTGEFLSPTELREIMERETGQVIRSLAVAVNRAGCDAGQSEIGWTPDGNRPAWLESITSATVSAVRLLPDEALADRDMDRRLEHARGEL